MEISFSKYTGIGNDFIIIDNRDCIFPVENSCLIRHLCHRRLGIGADGLILLQESEKADYRMRIFNPDGNEASMCGNGLRCLAKFIYTFKDRTHAIVIESQKRQHRCSLSGDTISVEMGEATDITWDMRITIDEKEYNVHYLNTGVPHIVNFVTDIEAIDFSFLGSRIRHHPTFHPEGVNVNFACISPKEQILMRTYERGVEGETFACGTGATAVALSAANVYNIKPPIEIRARSGNPINIDFSPGDHKHITMRGASSHVFTGHITIPFPAPTTAIF